MIKLKRLILLGSSLFLLNSANSQQAPEVWDVLRSEFSINHEVNRPEVQEQIKWLAAHPGYLNKVSQQAEPYIYHIVTQIKKRRLPGELALLPIIESSFNPFAYSGAGAAGLWQLMPKTGSELGLKQDWWFDGRRSIGASTDAALNYLVYLNNSFNGSWILAIASYDAGEGTISRAIKALGPQTPPIFWNLSVPQETQIYVPRLLALAEVIKNPAQYHINLQSIPYLPYFEEVNIGSQIDLSHAARMAGISYKELIKLNPGYNRWTTAPYKPFKLLIPAEKVEMFNLNLSNVPEEKRASWTKLRVQRGNSVHNNTQPYHTKHNVIKQVTHLNSNTVQSNQAMFVSNTSGIENNAPLPSIKPLPSASHRRVVHIVQTNDNYPRLQTLYGVSAKEIQAWNKLAANQALRTGQQLLIWKKVKQSIPYTVKAGDTLSSIARTHNTPLNHLIELNPGLNQNTALRLGQRLLVG